MRSAIAILTYNRVQALNDTLSTLLEHCPGYPIAVFDDGSTRDDTEGYLKAGRSLSNNKFSQRIEAEQWSVKNEPYEVYTATRNLGVAGNTNRALKWFLDRGYDHVCVCNDDILAKGDFVANYGKAHLGTQIGLFCMCDFSGEDYKGVVVPYRGWRIKLLPRMTGIMLSMTRPVVETIGYMDMRFGPFGQEHCNFTNRARIAGFLSMDNQPQHCLDVEQDLVCHQEVESSVYGIARKEADEIANLEITKETEKFKAEGIYLPFHTEWPVVAAGREGIGISFNRLKDLGYSLVTDHV
jgi:hypothetical protein